jgi:hypothetical protein
LGDLLGDFAPAAPAAQAAPQPVPTLLLESDPQLPPEVFKQAWKVLPDREKFVIQLPGVPQLPQFLAYMQAHGIKAAASGVQNGLFCCCICLCFCCCVRRCCPLCSCLTIACQA